MPGPTPHIVLLSPGAKVALARAFADAIRKIGGALSGWEADPHAPAMQYCNRIGPGGPVENEEQLDALIIVLDKEPTAMIVPTRHEDLVTLSRARDRFESAAVKLALSSWPCVDICTDKGLTHEWLSKRSIPVPKQTRVRDVETSPLNDAFPLVAKDPLGSGSRSVRICRSLADVAPLPSHWILQSIAPGREYTVNVYVDKQGRSLCEIPHERIMTGEGEVVRGRTARIEPIMKIAREIAESLPGARGPMNIQIFWDAPRKIATVIEINPRFGGGYSLAHQAGGRFTDWLIAEHVENATLARLEDWEENLLMVRYRESLFFSEGP